jgi:exonuclease III
MKIATWNVNGLANFDKVRLVLNKLRDLKADIIVIQEVYKNVANLSPQELSKKIDEIRKNCQQLWNSDLWLSEEGRIGILSNFKHAIQITNSYSHGRVVDFTFTHLARGDRKIKVPYFTKNFRAVYAPASSSEKPQFWRDFPEPEPFQWILGDFNMAWHKKDRTAKTTSDNPGRMKDLMINHIDTHYEIRKQKPERTYYFDSKIPFRSTQSRIDYIFAPDGQLSPYADIEVVEGGTISDHSMLVLTNLERKRRKAQWRMNTQNLDDKPTYQKSKIAILKPRSLDAWDNLKTEIKNIHIESGAKNASRLKEAISNLTFRLANLHRKNSSPEEIARIKHTLEHYETMYATRLAIKSGTQWLEEGERSTKYFYRRFKERLQTARIPQICGPAGEAWVTAEEKVEAARNHLQQIWDKTDIQDPNSFSWNCPTLSREKAKTLIEKISVEEVSKTISGLSNNKAPGPDGIPSEFYKKHSEHIAQKLAALFNEILLQDRVAPRSWSESKCVLIPKKTENIDQLANWRPITLENCDLKIFSKILADRLQIVVKDLIGEGQTGFIAGRSIHESVLTIDAALATNEFGSYILSLDWSKAYDRVNHQWLSHCLKSFGLPQQFNNTIENLFYSRTATVAVDDISRIVECRQGVPQGDPIAPLLFVLALEPLMATVKSQVKGIQTPRGEISYVAFADDSTFMIADKQNLRKLVNILNEYTQVSGAVINWTKSALTPLSHEPPIKDTLFPVTEVKKPPPTLGFFYPLNLETSEAIWENLITKVENTFKSLGQRRSLTFAGRALVARTLALSKVWYISKILTPSWKQEKQLTTTIWKYIFGKSSIHPPRDVAILAKVDGGFGGPDIGLELQTYAAQLFYQAILNPDKPWAHHILSMLPRESGRTPPDLVLHFKEEAQRLKEPRKSSYKSHTVIRALEGWIAIQTNSLGQIEKGWSHQKIRKLIQPISPALNQSKVRWWPKSRGQRFTWRRLWSKNIPPKIRDIIWRAAFNALPSRTRIRHFSEDLGNCDLCFTPEDGPHMISHCAWLQHFWGSVYFMTNGLDEDIIDLIYGIGYQAVFNENIKARIQDVPKTLPDIYYRFKGLMNHYRKRLPSLQHRWPSKEQVSKVEYTGAFPPFSPYVLIQT